MLRLFAFWILMLASLTASNPGESGIIRDATPLRQGYAKIPFVGQHNETQFLVGAGKAATERIRKLCHRLEAEYKRYGWRDQPCGKVDWRAKYLSRQGYPLVYASFGSGKNTTLFLGGVHPDERTPIHVAFRLARHLHDNPHLYLNSHSRVIVAPIVNPDGFFLRRPLRTNGLVDVNRNFPTQDWFDRALNAWSKRRRRLPRYFPGYFPNTEIETRFQMELIDSLRPHKIFSIHAPMGFLDYDGPGDQKIRAFSRTEKKAKRFVRAVAEKSENYKIVDYSFYPGSLGNFAGNERAIPTVTLELENTAPRLVNTYWRKFLPAFVQSIDYQLKTSLPEKSSAGYVQ